LSYDRGVAGGAEIDSW
jgi:hypothetical protein